MHCVLYYTSNICYLIIQFSRSKDIPSFQIMAHMNCMAYSYISFSKSQVLFFLINSNFFMYFVSSTTL